MLRRAGELAAGSTDNHSAVQELQRLAGSRRRTLQQAEKISRLGRRHLEFEQAHHVHRLLYAALHDEPVPPADPDTLTRIAALNETFERDRDPGEVWNLLLAAQPGLQSLLDEARQRRFGEDQPAIPNSDQLADSEQSGRWLESYKGTLGLAAELKHVVGPQSGSTDPVIQSQRAYNFAERYLPDQRPEPHNPS